MKRFHFLRSSLCFAALFLVSATAGFAETSSEIRLTVDATQAPLKILRAHIVMPVHPGALTLYYPKWIPGLHEPAGPIASLTGLKFTANGKTIPWRRDLLDVFTFHVDVPPGASQLDLTFDYIEPSRMSGPAAGSATDKLLILNWNQVLLYPAGTPAAKITYKPTLLLPAGWKFGTALPLASESAAGVAFQPVSLERLVDSPLLAGEYYRAIDLTPPGEPIHHEIDLAADSEAALAMPPEVQRGLTNVVAEAGRLFGARHYREYHFLLTLSDHTPHFGLEHHECNDSRLPERVFLSPNAAQETGGLLAHEYAHSWSGKFRRPADLSTPEFQTPMETDLLWVYEGNTSYLGDLLAARSGLWTPERYRQSMAAMAASLGPGSPGRTWRPLVDTAVAIPGMFGGGGFGNWRRGSDYYEEGELVWLEVANIIHEQSRGQKSFEDFFHIFYGGANNGPEVKTYTFEDLVRTLNAVAPYDWASFFHARLTSTSADVPTGGIEAAGWRLTFDDQLSAGGRPREDPGLIYSLGLSLGGDGTVSDSIYNGPAFKAGITSGMKVVGVNGRVYSPDLLNDAIKASKNSSQPIQLLVVADEYYKTCTIDYHEGERYPHLVRDASKPDYLGEILKPLVPRN
jgi:predicted metalloprotease with PDZ domain